MGSYSGQIRRFLSHGIVLTEQIVYILCSLLFWMVKHLNNQFVEPIKEDCASWADLRANYEGRRAGSNDCLTG